MTQEIAIGLFAVIAVLILLGSLLQRRSHATRQDFVRTYAFPKGLDARFLNRRTGLDTKQVNMVYDALRQYFKIAQAANRKMVAMPSQAVDDLWHEFILYTRNYQAFCDKAFGRYLHHTPADAMSGARTHDSALRRAWRLACKQEGIDPVKPHRLPMLFAIDGLLGISDGFHYVPDCKGSHGQAGGGVHCGADLGSGSGDGDSAGDHGASDGGGGDAGSGCGGGGCGGD